MIGEGEGEGEGQGQHLPWSQEAATERDPPLRDEHVPQHEHYAQDAEPDGLGSGAAVEVEVNIRLRVTG